MKALFSIILLVSLCCFALPAPNIFFDVNQPDGSTFKARNVGDEYFHYRETTDGFPVVRDKMGFFSYANENAESSGNFVREEKYRTASEKEFLGGLDKSAVREKFKSKFRTKKQSHVNESGIQFLSSSDADNSYTVQFLPKANKNLSVGEKHVLVLLVQFKDIKFSSEDANAEYTRYMNEEGYNEHYNLGSVRDYFVENSMGVFTPVFDVVGPITLSGNFYETYGAKGVYGKYNEIAGTQMALREAVDSLLKRNDIDFKQYDNDDDGYLDFVYMYHAGIGSHDTEQDSSIWAHASKFASPIRLSRNLYIDRYACSSELDGQAYLYNKNKMVLSGIGAFVHEFSHVLGLADTYGQSSDEGYYSVGQYDLMASGSYNCPTNTSRSQSCAPPYYSAFERFSVGWFNPKDLYVNGSAKLGPVNNNVAYRIQNPEDEDEFYMLEYRSNKKWDSALPYHGMLVWHITFDAKVFESNLINTPTFDYVDLVEADGIQTAKTAASDPFPGYSRVKKISSFKTTTGEDLGISISEISEARDYSYVQFKVSMDAEEGSVQYMENDTEVEWVPESSSSEEIESSSSEESSSSVSSSSVESSSSEETPIVASSRLLVDDGMAYLFALNGKLLYCGRYEKDFEVPKEFAHMPVVLQVRKNGRVVKSVRLK